MISLRLIVSDDFALDGGVRLSSPLLLDLAGEFGVEVELGGDILCLLFG
jgi:hypothetical protein